MASSTVGLSMRVVSGLPKLRKFTLDDEGEYLIGRLPASDIQLEHGSVSGEHALLKYDGKHWTIKDLKSHNGTLLNGQRLGSNPEVLPDEGLLRLGGVELRFHLIASDELTSQLEMSRSGSLSSGQRSDGASEEARNSTPSVEARSAESSPPSDRPGGTVSLGPGKSPSVPIQSPTPIVSLINPPRLGGPAPASRASVPTQTQAGVTPSAAPLVPRSSPVHTEPASSPVSTGAASAPVSRGALSGPAPAQSGAATSATQFESLMVSVDSDSASAPVGSGGASIPTAASASNSAGAVSTSQQGGAPASEAPTMRRSKRRPPSTIVQLTPSPGQKSSAASAPPAWTSVAPIVASGSASSSARQQVSAPAKVPDSLPPPIPGLGVESLLGSPPIDDSPPTLTSPHLRARALSARRSSTEDFSARKGVTLQEDESSKALETLPSPKLEEALRAQAERGPLQVSLTPQLSPPPSPGGAPSTASAERARSLAGSTSSPSAPGQAGRSDPSTSGQDVARLKHELEQTRRQLSQLLDEKAASRRTLDQLRQETTQRSQECVALQKSQAFTQKELASAVEALSAMRTREEQAMRWLETQRQQRDALQRENEGLKRSLEHARAERGSSSRDQERYLQENSTLRQELARVQGELVFLKQGAMGAAVPTGSAPSPAGEKSPSGSEGSRQELEALKQRNQSLQKALLELRHARGGGMANPTVRALFEEGASFGERLTTLLESLSRSLEDSSNPGERRAILQKASEQLASFMAWLEEGKARKD